MADTLQFVGVISVAPDLLADRKAFIEVVGYEVFELLTRNMREHDGAPVLVQVLKLTGDNNGIRKTSDQV